MKAERMSIGPTLDGAYVSFFVKDKKAALKAFDDLNGKPIELTVKPWRNRRSLNANAYFHSLCNKIAEAQLRMGNDEVKRMMVLEYGALCRGADGKVLGAMFPSDVDPLKFYAYPKWYMDKQVDGKLCSCYLFYKHTSDLDTLEMSRLIDGTVREAVQLGIDVLPVEELNAMKKAWGNEDTE